MKIVSRLCFIVTVLAGVFGHSAQAQEASPMAIATPITKLPFTITKPGLYLLKKDLDFTAATGSAIAITAELVTLDLGGHRIRGRLGFDDTYNAVGISGTGSTTTIRNGIVSAFRKNIEIGSGDGTFGSVVIEGVSIIFCGEVGMHLTASNIEVRHCLVTHGPSGPSAASAPNVVGIDVHGEHYTVEDNIISLQSVLTGQFPTGLHADGVRAGGVIARNQVSLFFGAAGSFGIVVDTSPALVFDNTAARFIYGFSLPAGSKYKGNLTTQCGTAFVGSGTAVGSDNN